MNFYILAFLLLFTVASSSLLLNNHPDPKTEKAGTAKIVFKSTDGGQTWQDISKGLPENYMEDGRKGNSIFANDKGLFPRILSFRKFSGSPLLMSCQVCPPSADLKTIFAVPALSLFCFC